MGFGGLLSKGMAMAAPLLESHNKALGGADEGEYQERAAAVVKADVFMISGCQDKQTSADVSNVSSFGLPANSGPGGAGGACTNALLSQAYKPGERTWIELLSDMRGFLKRKGYTQVPQLSTSRKLDLKTPFSIGESGSGRKIAVMVGINYQGHSQGQLSGCVNDVVSMKQFLTNQGFQENDRDMQVLVDVPHHDISVPVKQPTRANITAALQWLVSQARPGDTLFFHYSGHGGQQRDESGDEEDGMDETLIPYDYRERGVITDDELFDILVGPLPQGVKLVCLMDCCHSGTILDLPFTFVATEEHVSQVQSGAVPSFTLANPEFQAILKKLLKKLGEKYPQVGSLCKLVGI